MLHWAKQRLLVWTADARGVLPADVTFAYWASLKAVAVHDLCRTAGRPPHAEKLQGHLFCGRELSRPLLDEQRMGSRRVSDGLILSGSLSCHGSVLDS